MWSLFDWHFVISGFLVGLLVGQTGVGGGALMTPLLVLVFGVNPAVAVGTDLLYAGLTKSVGALVHGANRTVDWRVVRRLAAGSVPATLATLAVAGWFGLGTHGGRAVAVVLGVVLLLTATALLTRRAIVGLTARWIDTMPDRRVAAITVGVGAALGTLVTISSVGAGALGVTALLLLYPRAPMARIVGSDIAHAVPLTLVAGLGHLLLGSVDGAMLAALLAGSLPGIALGSLLAVRMPDRVLRPALAAVLTLVGVRLVF